MATLSAKMAGLFRSLKTDAVPRAAQTQHDAPQGIPAVDNVDSSTTDGLGRRDEHAFSIHLDSNSVWEKKKPKSKKTFFIKKTEEDEPKIQEKSEKINSNWDVNSQASDNKVWVYLQSPAVCGNTTMPLNRNGLKIVDVDVKDVRFPTSLGGHGSDALHTDPNYSCAYVTTTTENGSQGYGLTFTCGRGTEIIVLTIRSMKRFLLAKNAVDIFADFASFWRAITNDSQMRWIGPEKGVAHLAVAAILNSLWDLWARLEKKPLWRLLADMEPEVLVSTIDFRYITDVVTKEEAILLLKSKQAGKQERIKLVMEKGYPAYTTQVGWLGYSDSLLKELCDKYLKLGFTHFKVKVGLNFEDDWRRCSAVRKYIGDDKILMVDANQAWSVNEAIEWMKKLAPLKPMWIEEPTSPDDVLGHATISKALEPYGIGVATGEMCANRVMFKQFLQSGGMQFCQIDSARIGSVNEIMSVYLMAEKLNVKVCPHAGGVGLCEMVQHLQLWDFASVSAAMEGRLVEYVDQQHEHFTDPCVVENARYLAPKLPGYSTQFKAGTVEKFGYPRGTEWQNMFKDGVFPAPDEAELVNP